MFTTDDSSGNYSGFLYERLGIGTRSEKATGRDLVAVGQQDLSIDNGDFKTITGTALIKAALIRRLGTPEYGYRRWVRSAEGLREIDIEYGDRVFLYLSAPNTPSNVEQVRLAIFNCMAGEQRIDVIRVEVQPTTVIGRIPIKATYRIKGESELQALDYVIGADIADS